jgi:predicted transcriptional regulator
MKQILVEIDDACARDLERVAPAGKRLRAVFIRLAIRRAVDLALDRATESAYGRRPVADAGAAGDLLGWDPENALAAALPAAKPARRKRAPRAAE